MFLGHLTAILPDMEVSEISLQAHALLDLCIHSPRALEHPPSTLAAPALALTLYQYCRDIQFWLSMSTGHAPEQLAAEMEWMQEYQTDRYRIAWWPQKVEITEEDFDAQVRHNSEAMQFIFGRIKAGF